MIPKSVGRLKQIAILVVVLCQIPVVPYLSPDVD